MRTSIEETRFSCSECGGSISMVRLGDDFPVVGSFTCCPKCGIGNLPLENAPLLSYGSRSLPYASGVMITRPELPRWQLRLRRKLRRELR